MLRECVCVYWGRWSASERTGSPQSKLTASPFQENSSSFPDCFVWMYRQILQTIQKKDRGSLGCFISAKGGKAPLRVDLRDLSDTSGSSAQDARNGSIVRTSGSVKKLL